MWLKTGDPMTISRPWREKPCGVDGCGKPNNSKGLCASHAWRLRNRGEVGGAGLEKNNLLVHGTVRGYKHYKCRCAECCETKRLYEFTWRAKNRQSVRDRQANYRSRNSEKMTAYRRRWKMANPDKINGYDPVRAAAYFDSEAIAYAEIIIKDPCVYCGAPSTEIDHIVPVSISHSSHWTNLAPACGFCNSSKGAKSLLAFLMYQCRRAA